MVFFCDVSVYESTSQAHLRVNTAPFNIASSEAGRVVKANLKIGTVVKQDSIIIELDSTAERLALEQAKAEQRALESQIIAFRTQITSAEEAMSSAAAAADADFAVAQAIAGEVKPLASASTERAEQMKRTSPGAVPQLDLLDANAQATSQNLKSGRLVLEASRTKLFHNLDLGDRKVVINNLTRLLAELDGRTSQLAVIIKSRELDLERRNIRSPIEGILANSAQLEPGSFLNKGDPITLVIPKSQPATVEADFPIKSLGQLQVGQLARVRLQSFPWTQYGELLARVSVIDQHSRAGLLRVELQITAGLPSQIPLQHGLTGLVEVTVDRVSPATLATRAIAGIIARGSAPSENINPPRLD